VCNVQYVGGTGAKRSFRPSVDHVTRALPFLTEAAKPLSCSLCEHAAFFRAGADEKYASISSQTQIPRNLSQVQSFQQYRCLFIRCRERAALLSAADIDLIKSRAGTISSTFLFLSGALSRGVFSGTNLALCEGGICSAKSIAGKARAEVDLTMKQVSKKVANKVTALAVACGVMGAAAILSPSSALARSSWYVGFSTGPVCVGPPVVYCPPPVVRCRPVYYYYDYPCTYPAPVVYYPAPVISVGYYRHRH